MMKTRLLPFLALLAALAAVPSTSTEARAFAGQDSDISANAPAVVFIIRHGEKPEGDEKQPDLTPTGYQRARALPSLFLQAPGSTTLPRLPRPVVIFATDTSKHSNRPIETVTPLSQALHLPINHDFMDIEASALAKEVMSGKYAGKVVLICWHHGQIPNLARAFGVMDAPKKWDPSIYDQIWMIEWIDKQARFSILPEHLMPGDSAK